MFVLVNIPENSQAGILENIVDILRSDAPGSQGSSHDPDVLGCKILPRLGLLSPESLEQGG